MIDTDTVYARILKSSPQTAKLLALLNQDGHETRIIGGAIRNTLFKKPVSDIDMATTLLPEAVIKLGREAGLRTIPTGISHGTVTLVMDGHPFEITTLREDIETNGRHAKVRFTHDFEADALRRDFTINALSMDMAGKIYDYTDGLNDISKQTVRFIGDPLLRIQEDCLRILRFFRFSASYGKGKLHKPALEACLLRRKTLSSLPPERIGNEMRKWLAARYVYETMHQILSTGFPEFIMDIKLDYDALKMLVDAENKAKIEPTFIRRLAAISYGQSGAADTLLRSLKLSNREYAQLQSLHQNSDKYRLDDETGEAEFKKIIYKIGSAVFTDWLLLNAGEKPDLIKAGIKFAHNWPVPKNPFSGEYFIKQGLKPGPDLGDVLKQAEKAWMDQDFTIDPNHLKAIAKNILG